MFILLSLFTVFEWFQCTVLSVLPCFFSLTFSVQFRVFGTNSRLRFLNDPINVILTVSQFSKSQHGYMTTKLANMIKMSNWKICWCWTYSCNISFLATTNDMGLSVGYMTKSRYTANIVYIRPYILDLNFFAFEINIICIVISLNLYSLQLMLIYKESFYNFLWM